MHIMDGIVTSPLLAGATIIAVGAVGYSLKRVAPEDIPKIALLAAAFFVASVIRLPIGPTSAHLMLTGLLGLILGQAIFPALLAGLMMQTFIFGFGGITVLGLNLLNMSLPGFVAYLIFMPLLRNELFKEKSELDASQFLKFFALSSKTRIFIIGFCAGSFAVFGSLLMVALSLTLSGQEFFAIAKFMILANLPLAFIEGLVVGVIVQFLTSLKGEMFEVNSFHQTHSLRTSSELSS